MDPGAIFQKRAEKAREVSERLSNLRGAVFFGAILSAALLVRRQGAWAGGALAVGAAAFVGLVLLQARWDRIGRRLEARLRLLRQDRARAELDWEGLPRLEHPSGLATGLPAYFSDLDLVGEASLLRLVNATVSEQGLERLYRLFGAGLPEELPARARQAIVRELQALRVLRMRFRLAAEVDADRGLNARALAELVSGEDRSRAARGWALAMGLVQLPTHFAFALWLAGLWQPYFAAGWLLLLLVFRAGQARLGDPFETALSLELQLRRFRRLAGVLERHRARRGSGLEALLGPFHQKLRPSTLLRSLSLWVSLLGAKANPALHFLLNAFVPWDFLLAARVERSRKALAQALPRWVEAMARFEALQSLAGFAQACGAAASYPELLAGEEGPVLEARDLGHPLIPACERVSNSLRLDSGRPCVLITGSNMSGKSTWLRTLGVNAVLARAGGPVIARRLAMAPFRVETSLRKRDSLVDEVSTFYAEVRRLREVLDAAAEADPRAPVLYLIDEIFQGTNHRERLAGSRAYIEALLATRALGLIATHDLELAELERDHPGLRNMHFRETIEEGRMSFGYELREGPCVSTNALRVMELGGLPVPRGAV